MSIAERQALRGRATVLSAEGFTSAQIGALLGVSDSTIRNWLNGALCCECNAFLDGSNGSKAVRCSSCNARYVGRLQIGRGPVEQRALALLDGRSMRYTELQRELGITKEHTGVLLHRLRHHGLIGRVSRGLYRSTNKQSRPLNPGEGADGSNHEKEHR